jgi:hypothetical protein
VDESRSAEILSTKFDAAWQRRVQAVEEWNLALRRGEIKPTLYRKIIWCMRSLAGGVQFRGRYTSYEAEWREKSGLKKPSLVFAMNDVLGRFFWSGGAIKVCRTIIDEFSIFLILFQVVGDISQLMGPVLVKVRLASVFTSFYQWLTNNQAIINFIKARGALKARGEAPPSVGRGIGMALGLFFIIVLTSLMQHQVWLHLLRCSTLF